MVDDLHDLGRRDIAEARFLLAGLLGKRLIVDRDDEDTSQGRVAIVGTLRGNEDAADGEVCKDGFQRDLFGRPAGFSQCLREAPGARLGLTSFAAGLYAR